MLRSGLILMFAVLALALSGTSRAAVTVFHDETCTAPYTTCTEGAPVAINVVSPATVALNLFYKNTAGTVASSVPANRCVSGDGHEVCGWDIWVSTTHPSIILQSFVPDTAVGPEGVPSDIVAAISGNVARANGGIPTTGELGIHRIGTLYVTKLNAGAVGEVKVAGNLYVDTMLTQPTPPVTSGNTLAIAGAATDGDGDGVLEPGDNCPTVQNGLAQAGVANVGNQTDTDADLVGDGCDNCRTVANPRVATDFFTISTNSYATVTGDQRDDDHDGFGNKCDADFTATGGLVAGPDLTEFRSASNKARTVDTCGTVPLNQPCARYDLNESGGLIDGSDLTVFRALSNKAKGPTCPTCPLPCLAGSTASCSFSF